MLCGRRRAARCRGITGEDIDRWWRGGGTWADWRRPLQIWGLQNL